MFQIHEIAVNPKFNVENLKRGDNVYESVKATMHRAYWDTLREKMLGQPDEFNDNQAFTLLEDLKGVLKEFFASNNLPNAATAIDDILNIVVNSRHVYFPIYPHALTGPSEDAAV